MHVGWDRIRQPHRDAVGLTGDRFPDVDDRER
jgi:hypothetical protein